MYWVLIDLVYGSNRTLLFVLDAENLVDNCLSLFFNRTRA
jgi:hypothetical protein